MRKGKNRIFLNAEKLQEPTAGQILIPLEKSYG